MKSFRQHIKESGVLTDLIDKHDDPFSFLASAMDAIANGTLKLKTRGLANARELIAVWNKKKKRKIKLGEAVEYLAEKKQTYVKGWTLKNKINMSTTNFQNYHIKQVANNLSKFGLNKRSLLKIINDAWPDAPETFPKEHIEELQNGLADNNVYIEEVLQKKGYCMFVLDPTHGSIEGWDEKSAKLGAKVLDDKYLPFEKDGFKLFEVKVAKGRDKYIKSKYDWYAWLGGKQAAGKRTSIGSTMAQFREQLIKEAVLAKRKLSYLEVGHPRTRHIKGKWESKHVELYSKPHGGKMLKTPLSSDTLSHDEWGEVYQHEKDKVVHARGRIDHQKKEYSVAIHHSSKKREPHPKAIQNAIDAVHKHMAKHHPEYKGHEFGLHYY